MTGIYSILDEEGRIPKASNTTFLNKLKEKHGKGNPNFHIPKEKDTFGVEHYAGRFEIIV